MPVDDFFSTDTGSSTVGTTTLVLTVPRPVAAGKKLVLVHGRSDVVGSTIVGLASVTDSKANKWDINDAISIRANQGAVSFAHCDVVTALAAGDTITVTLSDTAARKFTDVWVCSGLAFGAPNATSGAVASANTNSNANGASATPTASLNVTASSCIIFAASLTGNVAIPASAGSGYTLDSTRQTVSGSNDKGWTSEHGSVTGTGTKTVTIAGASSSAWAMAAVAFSSGNAAPTANAGADQSSIIPGATVQLSGAGSTDPDGTVTGYAWRLVSKLPSDAPTPQLSSATIQKPTFFAPPHTADAIYTWGLTVTDDGGAVSTEDTVVTTVSASGSAIMTSSGWVPAAWNVITP